MYNNQRTVKREFEKKAWFLCKFLCRELTEENFELARAHVSICPGTKTKVKLNHRGWSVGTNIMKKAFVDYFPLTAIDNLCQDTQFVNVVFLILQLAETPSQIDQKYEILAYKMREQAHAKQIQNVFQSLTGQHVPVGLSRMSTSMGNLTLVPSEWRNQSRSGSVAGGLNDPMRRPTNGSTPSYQHGLSMPDSKRNIRNYYRANGSQDEEASLSMGSSDGGGHRPKYNGHYNQVKRIVKESIDSPDQSWSPDESYTKWSNGAVSSSRAALSSESSISSEEVPSTIVYRYNGNSADLYAPQNSGKYYPASEHMQQRQRGMLEVPEPQYRSTGMAGASSRSNVFSESASVHSGNTYLLNPKFKKSYAYRR